MGKETQPTLTSEQAENYRGMMMRSFLTFAHQSGIPLYNALQDAFNWTAAHATDPSFAQEVAGLSAKINPQKPTATAITRADLDISNKKPTSDWAIEIVKGNRTRTVRIKTPQGKEISPTNPITATELRLLTTLTSEPARVFSQEDLLKILLVGSNDAIKVHMWRLEGKIAPCPVYQIRTKGYTLTSNEDFVDSFLKDKSNPQFAKYVSSIDTRNGELFLVPDRNIAMPPNLKDRLFVKLTPEETRCLQELMGNPTITHTFEMFLKAVYPQLNTFTHNDFTLIRTVLSRLNAKLGPYDSPLILNVRGIGYRLATKQEGEQIQRTQVIFPA